MNPIENIRLSQRDKERLITLKRYTGLQQWNVLCRWAFCHSLADPNPPTLQKIPSDSSVEMTWKVFGGPYHELYLSLLKMRCRQDGLALTPETMREQFRLHLHRGIASFSGNPNIRSIEAFVGLAVQDSSTETNDAEELSL